MSLRRDHRWYIYLILPMLLLCTRLVWAQETYTFDPDHTVIYWSVNHLGFTNVRGKFFALGQITGNPDKLETAKVNVIIPMNRLHSGVKKLDRELMSKTYFDAAQYPEARFVSTKVVKTGKNSGKLYGKLTIKDITKPVVLDVKLHKRGQHPIYKKDAVGFSATGDIKRSDFNIRAYIPAVGDKVTLLIEAEAIRDFTPKQNNDN